MNFTLSFILLLVWFLLIWANLPINRSMAATLKHVAKEANVSVSTVSRVLTGQAKAFRISSKTEQIVRDAASKLEYRPSQLARSLQSSRTGLIGVVVPDISNPFFASIASEVTLDAEANGYCVLMADSRNEISLEKLLIQQLIDRRVEGLVVCPIGTEARHLEKIEATGLPLVIVDRGFPKTNIVTVTSDHCESSEKAARLLTDRGHRDIGAVQGLPNTLPNEQRLEGLRRALASCGVELSTDRIVGYNFTEDSGYESAKQLLTRFPQLTAIFSVSTPNALGAMRAVRDLGRRVPEDISIVTFDDHPFAEFMAVPLSTAGQDVAKLGRKAAHLVSDQIRTGKRTKKKLFAVTGTLNDRASIRDLTQG